MTELYEAARKADDFTLSHRLSLGSPGGFKKNDQYKGKALDRKSQFRNKSNGENNSQAENPQASVDSGKLSKPVKRLDVTCEYCSKRGHTMSKCWKAQRDGKVPSKPVAFAKSQKITSDDSSESEAQSEVKGVALTCNLPSRPFDSNVNEISEFVGPFASRSDCVDSHYERENANDTLNIDDQFAPFVSRGRLAKTKEKLPGSVPCAILRDTGASQSLVLS